MKSTSKIGSKISFAAVCTTRSRTVGIPSGRRPPFAFGIQCRRTACGRYFPARSVFERSFKNDSSPNARMLAIVSASTPAAPWFRFTRSHAFSRTSRLQMRSYSAWNRLPSSRLAAAPRRRCSRSTLSTFMAEGRGGWVVPARGCLHHCCDHALVVAVYVVVTTPGTLPSDGVLRRRHHRYYDPLGLPLHRSRLAISLVESRAPDLRPCRRISRVPCFSLDACCAPYPAGIFDDRFGSPSSTMLPSP